MSGRKSIRLHELSASENWRGARNPPEWARENARLYTGFKVTCAAKEWSEVVTHFEDGITTAYVTAAGFDLSRHGPAIHAISGKCAQHRKVVSQWFSDFCDVEVTFS